MMIRRRVFCQVLAGTGVAVPAIGAAQTPVKVYRLGQLEIGRPDDPPGPPDMRADPFVIELARLGLVEGVNLATDFRSARGNRALLDTLAAELVATRPDLIYTGSGYVGALALKKATTTIPVVFFAVGEPVAAGLVASLARPGGNLTGGTVPDELEVKRVQILFEILGASASVVLLTSPLAKRRRDGFVDALAARHARMQFMEVNKGEDLAPAFEQMVRQRVDGVAVVKTYLTATYDPEIVALTIKHRLPAIADGNSADRGMMVSYNVDYVELERKAASYVYRILKGAQPGELPIEQPTKFEFVINMKAAKAMGVRIPLPVLTRATRVID